MKKIGRKDWLMPEGIPKWIRVYDNGGESVDRYTIVFTRAQSFYLKGLTPYLAMSEAPFHPQGFCQHGEYDHPIDRPMYSHLGKKIKFQDLPGDCQKAVLSDYKDYWSIKD